MTDAAIDIRHAEKTYRSGLSRRVHALRGVDLRMFRGEIFGLLGPNGAGKSTLVKILMTLTHPTRIEGSLLGHRIGDKRALRRVGYLPEHHRFPPYLTARQVLAYLGGLSGLSGRDIRTRSGELLELVGLTRDAGRSIAGYSKGMRQRLGIAQSLLHEPDLVLLDEPTDGVDPVGRAEIRRIIARLKEDGVGVLINSHLLSELEAVSDRVAILVKGRVGMQGTIDDLTIGQRRYRIRLHDAVDPAAAADLARRAYTDAGGPRPEHFDAATDPATIELPDDDPRHAQPVIDALRARGVSIASLMPIRPSLEDLFMQAVRLAEAEAPPAPRPADPAPQTTHADDTVGEARP